jgi:nitric oxide reductase subunit B
MQYKKLWITFAVVLVVSFGVLGGVGYKGIKNAPPIPGSVVTADGTMLFNGETIRDGQNVWQSIGGQEVGSIFGHGSYVAPDWTADYLHRESILILDGWAQQQGVKDYASLSTEQQAPLQARLQKLMRTNTYNAATDTLVIPVERAAAFNTLATYYAGVFEQGKKEYAIPVGALKNATKQHQMATFFFWTSWVASTERPGTGVTYTQNWPHEDLIGNKPTAPSILWSITSVVLLIFGIAALVWYTSSREERPEFANTPITDPLINLKPTPSQKATIKYFFVVVALWILQIALGAITAHYGVEGQGFYGFDLSKYLPYTIARTWHLQIAIFWIATSWLATGLYIAPAVGGGEPKGQRLGVNILFGALVAVVGGSLAGEYLGIQQKLGNLWFWFGSQGYEYVDLGRVWQVLLFGGLVFWLWLMYRALTPALKKRDENFSLLTMFVISAIAIPTFYAAGLMYGQRSHIVTAEYWRWWVVHLWVEGFFEVFATVVIAFLFTRLRILSIRTATRAVLFSTVIFLGGGIIGTFHHLYFTGMPVSVLALGAVFSAMEVVPLSLVGMEAWENIRHARGERALWMKNYKWPVYFFVAVAFWNLVGAGVFGFLINPPVSLYYVQGLNLTPVHGHTALFGVYGMLGLGLMLFSLRAIRPGLQWKDRYISISFWMLNIGLAAMVLLSVLPVGISQAIASIDRGTWYARSAEFLQQPYLQTFRWLRVPGDILFSIGALAMAYFVTGLVAGFSFTNTKLDEKAANRGYSEVEQEEKATVMAD